MKSNFHLVYVAALLIGDFIALMVAFAVAYTIRVSYDNRQLIDNVSLSAYIKAFLIITPLWLILFYSLGLYKKSTYESRYVELGKLLVGTFIGMLLIVSYDFVISEPFIPARLVVAYAFLLSFLTLLIERQVLWNARKWLFRRGFAIGNVMLIGSTKATKQLARLLQDSDTSGYRIRAIVGSKSVVPKDITKS